ncbi:MAG TPA: MFS transporter [Povalibacter sp.]|nr:MFS transporter [Povalibacter sp.]
MRKISYKQYLLTVLLVILASNLVDRVALGVLLQDIKIDLDLSDTQLGFLTGIAFALFYSVMGLPIARWADRGNRVTIITVTTVLWSTTVALCGFAANFAQLLLIRVGVAVGEAGCIPPAHSLIADYYTRADRPRAIGRYMLGYPLSAVLGYFLAGWLNELYGWRVTFLLLALPGLGLAALAWFTFREPRTGRASDADGIREAVRLSASSALDGPTPHPSVRDVCVTLWNNVTFRHLLLSWSVMSFFGWGVAQWKPAFFIRSYGLDTGEVGTWFAVTYGLAGFVGTYWGGELASRCAARNERLQLKAMAVAFAFFAVISAGIYVSSSPFWAFVLMGLSLLGVYTTYGPLFATIQTLVPPRMRASALATVYLFANLIGLGLGPLAAGALSDALRLRFGEESLRYALLAMCPGYLWAAWHLYWGSRTIDGDLQSLQQSGDPSDAVDGHGDSHRADALNVRRVVSLKEAEGG